VQNKQCISMSDQIAAEMTRTILLVLWMRDIIARRQVERIGCESSKLTSKSLLADFRNREPENASGKTVGILIGIGQFNGQVRFSTSSHPYQSNNDRCMSLC